MLINEGQRALDRGHLAPSCCLSGRLLIVSTSQHAHADTQLRMVRSLYELRLTSFVYFTYFEEVRVQTQTKTHTLLNCATYLQAVPLGNSATLKKNLFSTLV